MTMLGREARPPHGIQCTLDIKLPQPDDNRGLWEVPSVVTA